jgi:large subunit ribosomal protein L9
MKILLLKDVYRVGRAGEVKQVADGYARNYLIPEKFALLATPGVVRQSERIRTKAEADRRQRNAELSDVAEKLNDLAVLMAGRAGDKGKLYGSITAQDVANAIARQAGVQLDRRDIEMEPIRALGEHPVSVHLTADLMPRIRVIVYREGETPPVQVAEAPAAPEETTGEETAASTETMTEETAQPE